MRHTSFATTMVASLVFGRGSAGGATIEHGGFEAQVLSRPFETFFADSPSATLIPGWVVSMGSVDVVGSLWQAAEGRQARDLDGSSMGNIHRDIAGLTIGRNYDISFKMSGNGAAPPPVKTMEVLIGAIATLDDIRTGGISTLPLPTSMLLLGAGVGVLALRRRRTGSQRSGALSV